MAYTSFVRNICKHVSTCMCVCEEKKMFCAIHLLCVYGNIISKKLNVLETSKYLEFNTSKISHFVSTCILGSLSWWVMFHLASKVENLASPSVLHSLSLTPASPAWKIMVDIYCVNDFVLSTFNTLQQVLVNIISFSLHRSTKERNY